MECSWLRVLTLSICFYFCPFSFFELISIDIIEPCLLGINTTKNYHALIACYCSVSVPWRRSYSSNSFYFVPVLRSKRKLIDIIKSVMAVPTSKNKHRVLVNYCCMTKPV